MKTIKLLTASMILASTLIAGGETYYEHARVTKSEPIYEYVYKRESNRECYEEKIRVQNHNNNSSNNNSYYGSNSIGLDTIIGATTGIVIGNQIGKGNGRTAAKIVGGLLGGVVANNMRNQSNTKSYDEGYTYETRTKCYNNPRTIKRKMVTGYKNYFFYNGNEHFKVTNKPRKKVRITHNIDF